MFFLSDMNQLDIMCRHSYQILFIRLLSLFIVCVLLQQMLNAWNVVAQNSMKHYLHMEHTQNYMLSTASHSKHDGMEQSNMLFSQKLLDARKTVLNYAYSKQFHNPCENESRVNTLLLQTRTNESPMEYVNAVGSHVTGSITVLWKRTKPRYIPVFQYYKPASNNCTLLKHRSIGTSIIRSGCTHNVNTTLTNNTDSLRIWTYVSLLPNSVVNGDGYVISNKVKLTQRACHRPGNLSDNCFSIPHITELYNEVFTIAQYWGEGFFHGTMENLPRLAPFLPFLKQVSHIIIMLSLSLSLSCSSSLTPSYP